MRISERRRTFNKELQKELDQSRVTQQDKELSGCARSSYGLKIGREKASRQTREDVVDEDLKAPGTQERKEIVQDLWRDVVMAATNLIKL